MKKRVGEGETRAIVWERVDEVPSFGAQLVNKRNTRGPQVYNRYIVRTMAYRQLFR